MTSLLLAMNMACTLFRITSQEALTATTVHAAKVLDMERMLGSLAVGKIADFAHGTLIARVTRPIQSEAVPTAMSSTLTGSEIREAGNPASRSEKRSPSKKLDRAILLD
jgi:hypothetical protein